MATTIQLSPQLKSELDKEKIYDRETYEEVIWELIEDTKEIDEQTKKELEEAREEIKAGKSHTFSEVKKELGL